MKKFLWCLLSIALLLAVSPTAVHATDGLGSEFDIIFTWDGMPANFKPYISSYINNNPQFLNTSLRGHVFNNNYDDPFEATTNDSDVIEISPDDDWGYTLSIPVRFEGSKTFSLTQNGVSKEITVKCTNYNTVQFGQNEYVRYGLSRYKTSSMINVYGHLNDGYVSTTHWDRNANDSTGYVTYLRVGGDRGTYSYDPDANPVEWGEFLYGKPFTNSGITAKILPALHGKEVELTYFLTNTTEASISDVKIGTLADIDIVDVDEPKVSSRTSSGLTLVPNEGNDWIFNLRSGTDDFDGTYCGAEAGGHSYETTAHIFSNTDPTPATTDRIAWSWSFDEIPANTTVTRKAYISLAVPTLNQINFDPNGGEGTIDPIIYAADTTIQLPNDASGFTRERYQLVGWSEDKTATSPTYRPNVNIKMPAQDMTLYAVWQLQQVPATATSYRGTYDGQSHGITVSVDPSYNATIRYKDSSGNYTLTSSPTETNATDTPVEVWYQATADGYASKIGRATITINPIRLNDKQVLPVKDHFVLWPDQSTYTLKPSDIKMGDTIFTDADVTINEATTNHLGTNSNAVQGIGNYMGSTNVEWTLSQPVMPNITEQPKARDLTENGSAQVLVTAGTTDHGTMVYVLGSDAKTAPTEGWDASIPTGTAAKTYYVWYRADYDYSTEPACVTVTIKSKQAGGGSGGGGGGGGGETPTPVNPTPNPEPSGEPDPTPDPEPTGEPAPEPVVVPDPAESLDPTADPSANKTPQGDAHVTEEDGVKTTEQANSDGSNTKVIEDSNTGTKTVVVTEKDGTEKTQTVSGDASTGYVTESISEVKPNGDFVEKTVIKNPNGTVTEESTSSQITNELTGEVTLTGRKIDANGTKEIVLTTEQNGDYVGVEQTLDKNGNLVEKTDISKQSETNGDYIEKSTTVDSTGKILESNIETKKTDASTGQITESKSTVNRDGTSKSQEVVKDKTGSLVSITNEENLGNLKENLTYAGNSDGKSVTLTSAQLTPIVKASAKDSAGLMLEIPTKVEGLGNDAWVVNAIGTKAFVGGSFSNIKIPDSVTSIGVEAFKDTGATKIYLAGKVTKNLFGKDALKGNGTGKKGKGLTLYVASKKDMKQMKKSLKKAGVAKAKVKIEK